MLFCSALWAQGECVLKPNEVEPPIDHRGLRGLITVRSGDSANQLEEGRMCRDVCMHYGRRAEG